MPGRPLGERTGGKTDGGKCTEKAVRQAIAAAQRGGSAPGFSPRVMASGAAGFVSYNLAPPLRPPPARKASRLVRDLDGPIGCEVRDLKVTAGDEVAFAHASST